MADDQHVLDAEVEAVVLGRQKARSYRGSAQSIPNNTFTKIGIDADSFDSTNITDLVNHRIVPTLAGYYIVVGCVAFISATVTTTLIGTIYKNGVELSRGGRVMALGENMNTLCSDIVYLNGTTDYVELFIYQNSGETRNLEIGTSLNYLSVLGPF